MAVAIKTVDRKPKANYLGATLANLERAGVFESEHLHSITLVDSGSPDFGAFWSSEVEGSLSERALARVERDLPDEGGRRTLQQNAARAIRVASRKGADLVLVLEDDLDVVDGLLETVVAWYKDHEESGQTYALGANYARIQYLASIGRSYWHYPVKDFYGAQALLWSRKTAVHLEEWLGEEPVYETEDGEERRGRNHDLLLHRWAEERGHEHFIAAVPSLVQHVGQDSTIGNEHFAFPSFPGHDYDYPGRTPVVLWVGDATVATGFARCTHNACDALHAAGWEVHVLGLHHYGDPHPYPYQIWPPRQPWDGGRDIYGVSRLPLLIERQAPDVVVLLADPWNLPAYLESIDGFESERMKQGLFFQRPKIVGWVAVDAKNQKGEQVQNLDRVITWTRFAAEELKSGGYDGEPSIVPLGVDPEAFRPMDKAAARQAVLGDAVPPDGFVVGVVGRDQPRKRMDLTLEYFAEWIKLHQVEDAYLLLHVSPTGEASCDLRSLVRYHGLGGRVILSEPHVGRGHTEQGLLNTYNAMDVYMTTTQGEGFGLPALEAMACGVPCIVPRWSALSDWPGDAAVQVPCSSTALNSPMNQEPYTIGGIADRKAFVQELDSMYRSEIHRKAHRERGLRLAQKLTWQSSGELMVRELTDVIYGSRTAQEEAVEAPAEEAV